MEVKLGCQFTASVPDHVFSGRGRGIFFFILSLKKLLEEMLNWYVPLTVYSSFLSMFYFLHLNLIYQDKV